MQSRRTYRTGFSSNRSVLGLRSGFEDTITKQLEFAGVEYTYELRPLYFIPPAKRRKKTFDFFIRTLGTGKLIVVETKGWWKPSARLAELECIKQNPDFDIRYVFMNPNSKISKRSKTTYANVCDNLGIAWAKGSIPMAWLHE